MKHSILFSAILASLCVTAHAQSNVTVYGRLNTTLENQQDAGAGRVTTMNNNSSRFGFRGTEDMGGGMKTSFVLESGFNSTNGALSSSAMFGRQASLEVSSASAGGLRLGRWFPGSYFATADYVSNHNHDTGRSGDNLYSGDAFGRSNSKIGYFTPNWNGFTGEASYAFKEGTAGKSIDLAGNYVTGNLHAGLGYTSQDKYKQAAARAIYFMGPLAVGGYVQRETVDGSAFGSNRNIFRLSGMYTMGASEFHVNFGGSQKGGNFSESAKQGTLGYNYNLSKRSKIYTYYTKTTTPTSTNPLNQNSFAVGVRHNF
jgi:predicted porin